MTTDIRGDQITKQIQEIQASLNTPIPSPSPTTRKIIDERGDYITKQIQKIQTSLDTTTPPPSPTITKEIIDERVDEITKRIQELRSNMDRELIEEKDGVITRHEKLIQEKEELIKIIERRINIGRLKINNMLRTLSKVKELNIDNETKRKYEEEHKILNKQN